MNTTNTTPKEVELFILRTLQTAANPISPDDLLAQGSANAISQSDLRQAVWYLVSSGQAEFTEDMRLEACARDSATSAAGARG